MILYYLEISSEAKKKAAIERLLRFCQILVEMVNTNSAFEKVCYQSVCAEYQTAQLSFMRKMKSIQ